MPQVISQNNSVKATAIGHFQYSMIILTLAKQEQLKNRRSTEVAEFFLTNTNVTDANIHL